MTTEDKTPAYRLEPLWDEIMKVYAEYSRICKKYGLCHYLSFGSAIGAVRHHGFIPWDDDLDVLMPRPDYERFVEVAPKELPANMMVRSWRLQPDYIHVFNKVQLIDDATVERVKRESNLNLDEGIYIDIGPIDGAPATAWGRQFYWLHRWAYRGLGVYLSRERLALKHLPLYLMGMVMHWLHPQVKDGNEATKLMDKWFQSYGFDGDGYTVYASEDREFYKPGCFKEPVMMEFGHWGEVPVPTLYDHCLRCRFGDYMQLPPEECRRPTHQLLYRA